MELKCYDINNQQITHLTQWDLNQQIIIHDLDIPETSYVHAANAQSKFALVCKSSYDSATNKLTFEVPNILLQKELSLKIYIYVVSPDSSAKTIHTIRIPVIPRAKPAEYIYEDNFVYVTPDELQEAFEDIQDALKQIDEALLSLPDDAMKQSIYDPDNKKQNIFKYADDVLSAANKYTDEALKNYHSFTINIVSQLPVTGVPYTIYFIPKDGGGYKKYWWIINSGVGGWDEIGGSSTIVVESLPTGQAGDPIDPSANYVVKTDSGYLLEKYINNQWEIIGGSLIYTDDVLPPVENGSEHTDYYIGTNNAYIHYRFIDGDFCIVGGDSYSKSYIDAQMSAIYSKYDALLSTTNDKIAAIENFNANLDTEHPSYFATYGNAVLEETGEEAENVFTLWEYKNDTESIASQLIITGGSGGNQLTDLRVEKITASPLTLAYDPDSKVYIEYTYSSVDSDKTNVDGQYIWRKDNYKTGAKLASGSVEHGKNVFEVTKYLTIGTNKLWLIVTDDYGNSTRKSWTINVVSLTVSPAVTAQVSGVAGNDIVFGYRSSGSILRRVHFELGNEYLGYQDIPENSGVDIHYFTIPGRTHGSYLLKFYATCTINPDENGVGLDITSPPAFKDIMWIDASDSTPIIGCDQQTYINTQYNSFSIPYYIYNPIDETPYVEIKLKYPDSDIFETVSQRVLEGSTDEYQFKSGKVGKHIVHIICGDTIKEIEVQIESAGVNISPIIENLAFDFDPIGKSNNNDADKSWKWKAGTDEEVSMTVSENFDWINGGYKTDENGDRYFCVKSGSRAYINYELFANDAKSTGKNFKVIFKTENIKTRDTSFVSCYDGNIGLDMKVESANIYSSNTNMTSPYSEEDIIEFEFNINPISTVPLVLTYEDGVATTPMIYSADSSFWQQTPKVITIGSDNCDVRIYRMKTYVIGLTDSQILTNFITDARNTDELVTRYNRNQISDPDITDPTRYKLSPEYLATKCPDLRIITIEAPRFTYDKDDKVADTTISMIYKNGRELYDNWTCTGAMHSGQGTSSNEYGYAGRNLDLIMNTDTAKITLGDGVTTTDKITLTEDSIPVDYLNIKVNIASSENANNALLARRYNTYNPFKRFAKFKDNRVKDCMEFYNCVVFIKETGGLDPNGDPYKLQEFDDGDAQGQYFHFYGIGNIGDSKKTDKTRVNNPNDPAECIIEITDYNEALSEFPTGNNNGICNPDEWKEGNSAYDNLYSDYVYKEGKFKSFGNKTYEFRYEKKNITDIERQQNIDTWREFYKFVVTSEDAEFKAKLKEYFVVDSALYYYLFTERYTMVDNRAKNSFWHYGKVYISEAEAAELKEDAGGYIIDNEQAAIRNGYRWDLSFGYDFDTALGINNLGALVIPYGKEDTDYYVRNNPASDYIYRAANSTFFCRLRDLFSDEMKTLFNTLDEQDAWSADSLIRQWDDSQSQFPEELWRIDIERKYLRTYLNTSKDHSIPKGSVDTFISKLNGKKKYQRRMFERNQELYISTKYFGHIAQQDRIFMRFNNPMDVAVTPNFTLNITPYSDMYINVSFSASGAEPPKRAYAGVPTEISLEFKNDSTDTAKGDITNVYGASFIQSLGDLSACYISDNDFSNASRLQSLVLGNTTAVGDGDERKIYSNPFMTTLSVNNNKLLENLDLRNITGFTSVVNLSNCVNLQTIQAEIDPELLQGDNANLGATGFTFADGGRLISASLPAVSSLTMKNLVNLQSFSMTNYDKLQTLIIENTPVVNTYAMIENAMTNNKNGLEDKLLAVRLIGMNWDKSYGIRTKEILEYISTKRGVNSDSAEIGQSVLSGYCYINRIGAQSINKFTNSENGIWKELVIDYTTLSDEWKVSYVDYDGMPFLNTDGTPLIYLVEDATYAPLPSFIPERESTPQYKYEFIGWDGIENLIKHPTTLTAKYNPITRTYTVTWYAYEGHPIGRLSDVSYGSDVSYEGETPINNTGESIGDYNLFAGWDKSTGFINGDTNVYAIWATDSLPPEGTDLKDMTPAEIYAVTSTGKTTEYFVDKDYVDITLGCDFNFDPKDSNRLEPGEVKSELLAENLFLDGSTAITKDIQLFGENEKTFTMAIDFQFISTNSGDTLVSAYKETNNEGFRLYYDSYPKIQWGDATPFRAGYGTLRNMLVLRHIKGENKLYIYASDTATTFSPNISVGSMTRSRSTYTDVNTSFGGVEFSDGYDFYGKGIVHWCKIWYDDLGDTNCRKLANWTRESLRMEYCGTERYRLGGDTTKKASASFICNKLLADRGYGMQANEIGNTGGWKASLMRQFLNDRVYKAFPDVWKSMIKLVKIKATDGGKEGLINTSEDFIYLPCRTEMGQSINSNIYNQEGEHINWYLSSSNADSHTRIKSPRFVIPDGYKYYKCTSDPFIMYQNEINNGDITIKSGDIWGTSDTAVKYIYVSQEYIDKYNIKPNHISTHPDGSPCGGWIAAVGYWLRTAPIDAGFSGFSYIANTGLLGVNFYAAGIFSICPCFSI